MQQEINRSPMPDHDGVSETERQVGKKAKRGVYEDDNVEWEDAPPAGLFILIRFLYLHSKN